MDYSNSVSEIAVKFTDLQKSIKAKEAEKEKLDSIIKEQEVTINALKDRKDKHQAINAKLTHYVKEVRERSESAEKETELVYSEILSVKKEIEEQASVFKLNDEINARANDQHALREKKLEVLHDKIMTLKSDQEKELEEFCKTLAEQKKSPLDELLEVEKQLAECHDERDQLLKDIDELKDKVNNDNKKIQTLASKKNMVANRELEKKKLLFELERKTHAQGINRETLCKEIQEEEKKKEDMDLKRVNTLEQINNVQNAINTKLQEKSSQEIEICDLKEKVAELEEEKGIQNDLILKYKTVETELTKSLSEKEHLEKKYADHCAGIELMKVELQLNTALEKDMSELKAMRNMLISDIKSLAQIDEKLKNMEKNFEELKEKESELQMKNELMQKEICDAEEENKLLCDTDEEFTKNLTMLCEEWERFELEMDCMNKALVQKLAEIMKMAELHKEKLAELDKKLANLEEETSSAVADLETENDEEILLCAQEINMKLKLQETQEVIGLKEAKLLEMENVFHEKLKENDDLIDELLNLEREIEGMTGENKDLDAAIEKCKRPSPGIKRKVKNAVRRSVPYTNQRRVQKESVSTAYPKKNEKEQPAITSKAVQKSMASSECKTSVHGVIDNVQKNFENSALTVTQLVVPAVTSKAVQKSMASNERAVNIKEIYVPHHIPLVRNMAGNAKKNFELEDMRMRLKNSQITVAQQERPAAATNECIKKAIPSNERILYAQKIMRKGVSASNVTSVTNKLSETIDLADSSFETDQAVCPNKSNTQHTQRFYNNGVKTAETSAFGQNVKTTSCAFTSNAPTLAAAAVKKDPSKVPELKPAKDFVQIRRKKCSANKLQRHN